MAVSAMGKHSQGKIDDYRSQQRKDGENDRCGGCQMETRNRGKREGDEEQGDERTKEGEETPTFLEGTWGV